MDPSLHDEDPVSADHVPDAPPFLRHIDEPNRIEHTVFHHEDPAERGGFVMKPSRNPATVLPLCILLVLAVVAQAQVDGSIVCWGASGQGQYDAPSPNPAFVAIAAGAYHNLALCHCTGIEEGSLVQGCLRIDATAPNPCRSSAAVLFSSPGIDKVLFETFDISGRMVCSEELGAFEEGRCSITWNGCDSNGEPLAGGIYLINLVSGPRRASTRVVLLS